MLLFTFNKELECVNIFCLFPFLGRFKKKKGLLFGVQGCKGGVQGCKGRTWSVKLTMHPKNL